MTEMYQESALREEMRIVAPLRHAREAEERVTVAGSRPAPSATAGDFAPSSYRQGPTAPEPLAPRTTPRP
ncbi:hypothetical protein [Streptomyces sp. NPDC048603]|uniref:hypothetical protein n=1 Tax=Streptomyces sp. NPDC048603 TaxID=3365577 RepID=UPI00372066A1